MSPFSTVHFQIPIKLFLIFDYIENLDAITIFAITDINIAIVCSYCLVVVIKYFFALKEVLMLC